MGNSRENSPDWLRSYEAPKLYALLSSDSDPAADESLSSDDGDKEEDESIIGITSKNVINRMSDKITSKKRAKDSDQVSVKKRKTIKQNENDGAGSEDDDDDDDANEEESSEKQIKTRPRNHLVMALSSDSESESNAAIKNEKVNQESSMDGSLKLVTKEKKDDDVKSSPKVTRKGKSPKKQTETEEKSSPKVARKGKSPKKQIKTETGKPSEKEKPNADPKIEGEDDADALDAPEATHEKHVEPRITSSTLPLILPEKVNRSKALVECEGETIDLSGDMGAVGRIIISEVPSKEPEMFLDLKGTIYKTTIVPSRTFCVVNIGQSEAKIEAIMNDFIQLTPQSNVYDAETMVEGTLDGFSFDSEDEVDKTTKDVKGDQNEGAEENPNEKPKRKTEKKMGATQKKGKGAGVKAPRKKKPHTTKKGKSKK